MSDDSISRQDVIDEIKEIYEWHDYVTEERIIEHFKRMPSAQPEIIRCKDCKYRYDSLQCRMYSEGMVTTDNWFCADGEKG